MEKDRSMGQQLLPVSHGLNSVQWPNPMTGWVRHRMWGGGHAQRVLGGLGPEPESGVWGQLQPHSRGAGILSGTGITAALCPVQVAEA